MPKAASGTPRCRRSTLPPEWRHVSGLHGGPSESTLIPQKKTRTLEAKFYSQLPVGAGVVQGEK